MTSRTYRREYNAIKKQEGNKSRLHAWKHIVRSASPPWLQMICQVDHYPDHSRMSLRKYIYIYSTLPGYPPCSSSIRHPKEYQQNHFKRRLNEEFALRQCSKNERMLQRHVLHPIAPRPTYCNLTPLPGNYKLTEIRTAPENSVIKLEKNRKNNIQDTNSMCSSQQHRDITHIVSKATSMGTTTLTTVQ